MDSGRRSSGLPFYLEGGNKWNEARETFGVSRHSWREKWEGGRATCRVDSGETKAGREEKRKKCLFRQRSDFPPPFRPLFPAFEFSAPTFFPFSRQLASFPKASFVETYQFSQFSWKKRRIEGSRRNVVGRRTRNNREKDRRCGGRNGIPMEGA